MCMYTIIYICRFNSLKEPNRILQFGHKVLLGGLFFGFCCGVLRSYAAPQKKCTHHMIGKKSNLAQIQPSAHCPFRLSMHGDYKLHLAGRLVSIQQFNIAVPCH